MRGVEKKIIAPILVAIVAAFLAGCYTLIKHPKIADVAVENDFNRCSDCHTSYPPPQPRPPHPGPWGDYYGPALPRREIIIRDPLERPIDDPGMNPPGNIGTQPPKIKEEPPSAGASPAEEKIIKKQITDSSRGDKRGIEESTPVKRGSDTGSSSDTKNKQSSDEKDSSKSSDETKDSKEKKKEQQ